MKRNPRKVKWTKAYRKLHGKDLAVDATFEMERKRNRPERYNREVVQQTVKAIQKITEIRQKRQDRFYENRMKSKKQKEAKEAIKELQENIHLVKAPIAMQADESLALPKTAEKLKVRVKTQQQAEPIES